MSSRSTRPPGSLLSDALRSTRIGRSWNLARTHAIGPSRHGPLRRAPSREPVERPRAWRAGTPDTGLTGSQSSGSMASPRCSRLHGGGGQGRRDGGRQRRASGRCPRVEYAGPGERLRRRALRRFRSRPELLEPVVAKLDEGPDEHEDFNDCARGDAPEGREERPDPEPVGDAGVLVQVDPGQDRVEVRRHRDRGGHIRDPPAIRDRGEDGANTDQRVEIAFVDARRQDKERDREHREPDEHRPPVGTSPRPG